MHSSRLDIINGHIWRETSTSLRKPDEFIYTLRHTSVLSYDQRLFYEQNGYIVIPDLVPDRILEECRQRFIDLCEGRIPRGFVTMMKDVSVVKMKNPPKGEALYYKVQDIIFDEVFEKYFVSDKLLDVVECFTGPNITAMHSMLVNKPPDVGTLSSRHPLHQDLYYFPFRPTDRIVASWTAMERIDESNGCLFVIPGSHKGVLHHHEYPDWEGGVNNAFLGIPHKDDHEKAYLRMEKGETVFFHPLLIHGSGINKTDGFRKAISCHYASSDCYYVDLKHTIQEYAAKVVEDMIAVKGPKLSIQEIWKMKSKPVRGLGC